MRITFESYIILIAFHVCHLSTISLPSLVITTGVTLVRPYLCVKRAMCLVVSTLCVVTAAAIQVGRVLVTLHCATFCFLLVLRLSKIERIWY